MRLFKLWALMGLLVITQFVYADNALVNRGEVQHFIRYMVKVHHFNAKQLTELFRNVTLQPQIIESMNKPYEKKNWDVYKQLFLTQQRVDGGVQFWQDNQQLLAQAEKQYGVPAHVIVAILGVETLYGKNQGNYRVIDALSTLAFNYPKRATFFSKELAEFLLLCREHKVSPLQYMGSYAGAMGKPQFMPSSYRYYAVNFSGNGKKDLMNDNEAVIASIANYFHKHGWHGDQTVAQPAIVNGDAYKSINTSNKNAEYHFNQLKLAGVKIASSLVKPETKVGLIELTTERGSEFWLTYPNFYVITRYNTSPQYALAVYLLSIQIKDQWNAQRAASHHV